MAFVHILPKPTYGDEWILDPTEVFEQVPQGDWVGMSAKLREVADPAERVLAFAEEVLGAGTTDTKNDETYTRTHPDGWTITGEIYNDWYSWVIEFQATHPTYGRVWRTGDTIYADSEAGFKAFTQNHPFSQFDYGDI